MNSGIFFCEFIAFFVNLEQFFPLNSNSIHYRNLNPVLNDCLFNFIYVKVNSILTYVIEEFKNIYFHKIDVWAYIDEPKIGSSSQSFQRYHLNSH